MALAYLSAMSTRLLVNDHATEQDRDLAEQARVFLEERGHGVLSMESAKKRYETRAHASQKLIMEIRSMIDRHLSEWDRC